jgi:hypothetical protein
MILRMTSMLRGSPRKARISAPDGIYGRDRQNDALNRCLRRIFHPVAVLTLLLLAGRMGRACGGHFTARL